MERAVFLVELTGERVECLLNPECLVVRRQAGIQPRRVGGDRVTGGGDDSLLATGGGRTELDLDLLFETSLARRPVGDVRELTGPLWRLSENRSAFEGRSRPPLVRFVWGKAWNVPGIVGAVAERLERFTPAGAPQRSWVRLRLLRVAPPAVPADPDSVRANQATDSGRDPVPEQAHQVLGGEGGTERLESIAVRYYGSTRFWRPLAAYNAIDDPLRIPAGTILRIPPREALPE